MTTDFPKADELKLENTECYMNIREKVITNLKNKNFSITTVMKHDEIPIIFFNKLFTKICNEAKENGWNCKIQDSGFDKFQLSVYKG